MQLTIDLTGSRSVRDELEYLRDAQQAIQDLMLPTGDWNAAQRDRIAILLNILNELWGAVIAHAD